VHKFDVAQLIVAINYGAAKDMLARFGVRDSGWDTTSTAACTVDG
jgi:hypothetical protein